MLLEALGLVLALYGGAEPALSCMPYLVSLLRPETAPPAISSKGHQPVPSGPAAKARPRDEVQVSSGAPKASLPKAALVHGLDLGREIVHGLEPRVRMALCVLAHAAKHAQNVSALVEAGGVDELSVLLTKLPMHEPLVEAALGRHATCNVVVGGDEGGAEKYAEKYAERPLEDAATLEAYRYGEAHVRVAACTMAVDVLDLLQTIALSSRRTARMLCASPHLERIAQAMLCGAPLVIERSVELLSLLSDSLPSLAPWLHASGAFHFVLATALHVDGHATLPQAAAQFLQRFHRRQQRPVLAPYLIATDDLPRMQALTTTLSSTVSTGTRPIPATTAAQHSCRRQASRPARSRAPSGRGAAHAPVE